MLTAKQVALQVGFRAGLLRLVRLARRHEAMILTFHRFSEDRQDSSRALPIQRFEEYMRYLAGRCRVVPLRDVGSLRWRSWRGGAALGLLAGPIVGAALGGAIGLFMLPHSCGPQCNDSEKQSLNGIGGLLVGGIAGLFLGPLVGAFVGGDSHVDFAETPRKPQPSEPLAPNPNG